MVLLTKPKKSDLTDEELAKILSDTATDDDLLIAQMLQMQFDREHDQALGKEESHRNGTKRLVITLSLNMTRRLLDVTMENDSWNLT